MRLTRLTVALIVTCSAMVCAARVVATSQPPDPHTLLTVLMTNSDGSACQTPCLLGIYPGQNDYSNDVQRLSGFRWIRDVKVNNGDLAAWFDIGGQNATFLATQNSVSIYIEVSDEFVPQRVSFTRPTLGDFLTVFGTPTYAIWKDGGLELWYSRPRLFVWCYPDPIDGHLTAACPIEGVEVYPSESFAENEFRHNVWHGITSLARIQSNP